MESTIDALLRSDDARRKEVLPGYRERLLRSDKPQEGDASWLEKNMRVLKKEPGDLKADLAILRAAAEFETKAATNTAALNKVVEVAAAAYEKHKAKSVDLIQARKVTEFELSGSFHDLQHRRSWALDAARKLRVLQAEHRELFGLPEPAAEPDPSPVQVGGSPGCTPDAQEEAAKPSVPPPGEPQGFGAALGIGSVAH